MALISWDKVLSPMVVKIQGYSPRHLDGSAKSNSRTIGWIEQPKELEAVGDRLLGSLSSDKDVVPAAYIGDGKMNVDVFKVKSFRIVDGVFGNWNFML
ncbi:hypothetical protein L1887_40688 [Cichorium endivia]|nr:hypothetical protein L1887_40688 [Cichorium endivia]